MKIRKLNAATALGSLTASVALLTGIQGAYAQGAPGAGSFPGSFLVPGTQTSFKVGGYIKWDYVYDFGQIQNINGGSFPFVSTQGGVINGVPQGAPLILHGGSQMTASESRFNIETRTPTSFGELKTFLEGDFTNPNGLNNTGSLRVNSNSYGFRLRQAYGTLGPFLAGQTLSLFRDGAAEAETLDFGGAQATGVTRQPQVRYTFDFGNGLTWAVAAENNQTQIFNLDTGATKTTFGAGQADKIPDFTTAVVYNAPWGHLNLHGVVRDIYWHNGLPSGTFDASSNSRVGWAVSFSGNYNVPIGKDSIAWEAAYGKGAGRYVNSDGPPTPDAFVTPTGSMHNITSWLGSVNYTHFWTDQLRTNIAGSYWRQYNGFATNSSNGSAGLLFRDTYNAFANLIWSPVPQTNFGVEFNREWGKLQDGATGAITRVQLSAQFKF